MKIISLLIFTLLANSVWAQSPGAGDANSVTVVDAKLKGVRLQVEEIDRIPGDRLLVMIKVFTSPAGGVGVQLGEFPNMPEIIPAGKTPADYLAKAFSLNPATMTEDSTQTSYTPVPPLPGSQSYCGPTIFTYLRAGGPVYLTLQFPSPPPPAPVEGKIPKQTVTLSLGCAKGPITKVVIPPPAP